MEQDFDYIIIGAGINALACVYGILQLNKKKKIALITGSPKNMIMHKHPKIFKDQMNSRNNIFLHESKILKKNLPGIISGLNYFWGEQCNVEELPGKKKNQKNYKFFSSFLELNEGKNLSKKRVLGFNININFPDQTITGEKSKKKFKSFFEKNCKMFFNEAISINKNEVLLDNKKKICAKKIIICAGLIGTTKLLKSICPDINFRFYDHSPKIDFIYSRNIFNNNNKNHIYNVISKIYDKNFNIKYYLKFYPLKSLELLFFFKRLKFILPRFILNYKLNFKNFYLIQKWDNYSIKEIRTDKFLIKSKFEKSQNFGKLDILYKKLKIFKIFSYRPNEDNFHFHNLSVIKNQRIISLKKFLKKYNPNVYCLSLLSEKNINCLPPTFMNCIKTAIKIKKIS